MGGTSITYTVYIYIKHPILEVCCWVFQSLLELSKSNYHVPQKRILMKLEGPSRMILHDLIVGNGIFVGDRKDGTSLKFRIEMQECAGRSQHSDVFWVRKICVWGEGTSSSNSSGSHCRSRGVERTGGPPFEVASQQKWDWVGNYL